MVTYASLNARHNVEHSKGGHSERTQCQDNKNDARCHVYSLVGTFVKYHWKPQPTLPNRRRNPRQKHKNKFVTKPQKQQKSREENMVYVGLDRSASITAQKSCSACRPLARMYSALAAAATGSACATCIELRGDRGQQRPALPSSASLAVLAADTHNYDSSPPREGANAAE